MEQYRVKDKYLEFLLGQMAESSILERVGLALTLQDGTLVSTLTKVATDSGAQRPVGTGGAC